MSTNNMIHVEGYWPTAEKMGKGYQFNEGNDNKKSFIRTSISVREAYKAKDSDEYGFFNVPIKAFGGTAEYMNRFLPGDYIGIEGEFACDAPYEKDGKTVYPGVHVVVRNVQRYSTKASRDAEKLNNGSANNAAHTATASPFAKKTTSSNPFARK